jgi:hypothetical protein
MSITVGKEVQTSWSPSDFCLYRLWVGIKVNVEKRGAINRMSRRFYKTIEVMSIKEYTEHG